jgi:hypothetical protein
MTLPKEIQEMLDGLKDLPLLGATTDQLTRIFVANEFRKYADLLEQGLIKGAKVEWELGWDHVSASFIANEPVNYMKVTFDVKGLVDETPGRKGT